MTDGGTSGGPGGENVDIRVLLVDDQALLRAGFRALIDAVPGLEVVGEAADGEAGVRMAVATRPDVVLLDVQMPRMDGLRATALITADPRLASTRVIVLTTFELDEYVFGALHAGASGFLLKDIEPEALIEAVRLVHDGQALLAPQVTRRLIEAYIGGRPAPPGVRPQSPTDRLPADSGRDSGPSRGVEAENRVSGLTPREREILALAGSGLSNHEIAEQLVLSPLTVKTHVSRVLTKLGARDRVQLVVVAYEAGLINSGRDRVP